MPYYAGDYYRGDYYRGDFIGSLKKIGGGLIGGVTGLLSGGPIGALGGAITGFAQPSRPRPRMPITGPSITIPKIGPFPGGQLRLPFGRAPEPGEGTCPSGFRLDKATASKCVPIRRMNPLNPRAARRAITRLTGFERVARRVMRFTTARPVRRGVIRRRTRAR